MFPKLTGLIAATHTPFHDDRSLNLDVIPRQAEHLAASGVSAVFISGTTGESHSLTVEERLALTRRWTEVVRGTPLKLIVHVGHNCQADATVLAGAAGEADAIASLAPSFFKPKNVDELVRYLEPLARAASDIPFYYYDIPSMTSVTLPVTTFLEAAPARIPNLAGVKYTNSDLIQLQECFAAAGGKFDILFGIDEILLASLAFGARGAVGSSYNFAAPIYRKVMAAFEAGDWTMARKEQARAVALIRLLVRYDYLPAAKFVMSLLGVPVGPARSPLPDLGQEAKTRLERELHETGLWDALRAS